MPTGLHVITGKGGTGKTTASAALALALARQGRRVLVMEVEGRDGLAAAFGLDEEGARAAREAEAPLAGYGAGAGSVRIASVDPAAALKEYLRRKVRLPGTTAVLESLGAVDFATTVAPGVRDVIVLGKVYDVVRRPRRARHVRGLEYDDVVLDAPPTGRVGRFLDAPAQVAAMARMGPVRAQADAVAGMLRAPGTRVYVVTLLEDLPVQETVEAVEELGARRLPLGAILVNQHEEPVLGRGGAQRVSSPTAEELRDELLQLGLEVEAPSAGALLRQLTAQVDVDAERAARARRLQDTGVRLVPLRRLSDPASPDAMEHLADDLLELA